MSRSVSSLLLSPSVTDRLIRSGFRTAEDLKHVRPLQLSTECGLSQQEALEVLQAVRRGDEGCSSSCSSSSCSSSLTALELLQKEEELRSIVTFSSRLDEALGGGLPVGKTTELCGAPGVGKTQLCLQLAVDVQLPPCFGGLGGQVVYLDTEGSFLPQRLVDVGGATVQHCSLLAEDEEQRVAMTTFTVDSILNNIYLVRCHDYVELLAEVQLLPDFLSRHPRVRLLVIDSVASPFRRHFGDLSARTRLLNGLAQQLIAMATAHDLAVLLTNQMTTRLRDGQSQLVPALGESWGHAPTVRLLLQWAGPRRLVEVFKSPDRRGATIPYRITAEGFRDDDQSDEPQSKRPRTHSGQSETV